MIASLPLALALSAVFVLTGAYALVRWSAAMTGPLPPARRMAELAHLLMSVAMLVMTWTWAGTTGVTAAIVLFTVFVGYFVVDAVHRYRTGSHGCAGGSAHALMAAAMVWMLAAMPLIMPVPVPVPVSGSAPGHSAHSGHAGDAGAGLDMAAPTGPSGWAVVLTVGVSAALLATSTFWAARALRGATAGAPLAATGGARGAAGGRNGAASSGAGAELTGAGADAGPADAGPADAGAGSEADAVHAPAPIGTVAPTSTPAVAVAVPAPHRLLGPRSDAGCHVVMGLAMIAMLLAMVAGW